ncbi:TPA: DUF1108 family protein [Staphylococcus aureus]|uniref:DUF1108 family protein n=1 Tax=Staphylococcus aureus TaxID=1280 RepID=UPI000DF60043|nr:DUF1108 family protein [Staphylococcus aureus]AXG26556.1 hypothetical protein BJL64_04245 [Staphylococcus aureus]AXG29313.1 hypothetical protein BJL65_04240 [Staphylococcus aureus]MCR0739533.1 DUF1108 family protein [Staphylococcus aureus]MDI1543071.1 DUF1108 family protein [Staphylococcus aureus]MEA1217539.1 DUF1108 family protein [Staphylococcus aureus]
MYYEIGDVCQKVINIDGFDFKLAVKKKDYSILVNILDLEDKFIDGINITNENDLYTALDILNQSIYEWIEENADDYDKLINLVMKW